MNRYLHVHAKSRVNVKHLFDAELNFPSISYITDAVVFGFYKTSEFHECKKRDCSDEYFRYMHCTHSSIVHIRCSIYN